MQLETFENEVQILYSRGHNQKTMAFETHGYGLSAEGYGVSMVLSKELYSRIKIRLQMKSNMKLSYSVHSAIPKLQIVAEMEQIPSTTV